MSAASIAVGLGISNLPQTCGQWVTRWYLWGLSYVCCFLLPVLHYVGWSVWYAIFIFFGLFLKLAIILIIMCYTESLVKFRVSGPERGSSRAKPWLTGTRAKAESQDWIHQWLLCPGFLCFSPNSRGFFVGCTIQFPLPSQVPQNAG